MTVFIKTGKLRLWLPVPLLTLRLLPLVPENIIPEIGPYDKETALELYRVLKRARADFPGLELVHVRSADGDEIIVKL